jgi:hypothetical protein
MESTPLMTIIAFDKMAEKEMQWGKTVCPRKCIAKTHG